MVPSVRYQTINDCVFRSRGKLKKNEGAVAKSNLVLFVDPVFSEFHESPFKAADLNPKALDVGLCKYYNAAIFCDQFHFFKVVLENFGLTTSLLHFDSLVEHLMLSRLPGFSTLYSHSSFAYLADRFSHNSNGVHKKDTSSGHGLKGRKKEVLQKWRPELEEAYSCFAKTLHQPVLAKAFLKDEIRDAEKDARSIMCFQLLMWMMFVKSMNGLQLYFLSGKSDSLCEYAGVSPAYWLKKLNNFSREKGLVPLISVKLIPDSTMFSLCGFLIFLKFIPTLPGNISELLTGFLRIPFLKRTFLPGMEPSFLLTTVNCLASPEL